MRASSRKEATIILLIAAAIVAVLFAFASRESAIFLGGTAAIATSFKFIIVVLIACIFLRGVRIPILAVGAAFIYESFLHLTLQGYWEMLGINPPFLFGFLKGMFAALVLLSIAHIVFRLDSPKKDWAK